MHHPFLASINQWEKFKFKKVVNFYLYNMIQRTKNMNLISLLKAVIGTNPILLYINVLTWAIF